MRNYFLSAGMAIALVFGSGCAQQSAPTTTGTPAAQATTASTPVAVDSTPNATATPEKPMPTVNLTSEEGISGMQKLVDDQVNQGILERKAFEKDNKFVKAYVGGAGVRRINATITHSPEHKEEVTYWLYEGKVVSLGGSGKDGDVSYNYWAGISPDGTLQMPFKRSGGESAEFTEDEILKRQADGQDLHTMVVAEFKLDG